MKQFNEISEKQIGKVEIIDDIKDVKEENGNSKN